MKLIAAVRWLFLALGAAGALPAAAGTLRGTLTRAGDGSPVVGAVVTASRPGFPFGVPIHTTTLSNAAGQYEFTGLPSAPYTVNADAIGTDLVRQLYPSAYCPPETCEQSVTLPGVTRLQLGETQVLEGIDFALARGGAIEGQVRRADTQALLSGTTVTILPLDWQVQTDASGTFHFTRAPTGSWRLRATGTGDLVSTLHPNVACEFSACVDDLSAATLVVLGAGASLTRDIAMPVGARISGVLQPASAVANHTIRFDLVYGDFRTASRQVPIGPDGSYRIDGLASGNYRLAVHSNVIRSQVYPDIFCVFDCAQEIVNGIPVATVIGQTTAPIDFTLTPAARVIGRVTDAATGLPLSDVDVIAYEWVPNAPPNGDPGPVIVSSAVTAADGSYLIEGISPRTVRIATRNHRGYRDERFDNQVCGVTPQCIGEDLGTLYPLSWSDVMTADFQLDAGASIFGRVRGPGGFELGLTTTIVEVYNLQGQRVTALLPQPDGRYQTTGMEPGSYRLRAVITFIGSIQFGQVYGGVSCSYIPSDQCDVGTGAVLNLVNGVPVEANIAIEPIFVGNFD